MKLEPPGDIFGKCPKTSFDGLTDGLHGFEAIGLEVGMKAEALSIESVVVLPRWDLALGVAIFLQVRGSKGPAVSEGVLGVPHVERLGENCCCVGKK